MSGLATEHLRERMFEHYSSDEIVPANYKVMLPIIFQILMTLKLFLKLRANLITKMNSLILNFHPFTELLTDKAATECKAIAEFTKSYRDIAGFTDW